MSIPVLHFTPPPRTLQTTIMERHAENDFPLSGCMEEGSAPVGSCSSTPNLREHAKPLYNGSLNNSGIIRALFDETLSPLESGDSGSEELEDELEQIGA